MRDVAADALLAHPVVDRGVDVVDAGVDTSIHYGVSEGSAFGCDIPICVPDYASGQEGAAAWLARRAAGVGEASPDDEKTATTLSPASSKAACG